MFDDFEVIRNQDKFTNSYNYILDLLNNYDYSNDDSLTQAQQKLWILDYRLTPYEEDQLNLTDEDWDNPKSHFDILKNDINGIETYQNNSIIFITTQEYRTKLKEEYNHNKPVNYNLLPFSLTIDQIQNILKLLEEKGLDEPTDILTKPLGTGQILQQRIHEIERQINELPTQDEMKNNVVSQANKLQKNYNINYVNQMNKGINFVQETSKSFVNLNSDEDAYLCNTPAPKSPYDWNVGYKRNGGGYKQQGYKWNKTSQKWELTSSVPFENNIGKDEVDHLDNFKVVIYDTKNNVIKNTYTKSNITNQDILNKLNLHNTIYQSCYYEREKKYGSGCREQIQSMEFANPPDMRPMFCDERKALNNLRNSLCQI